MRILVSLLLCLVLLPVGGFAQSRQYFRVQSGTGFFVNRQYIITNAHVVKGCTDVIVKGAIAEHQEKVTVLDEERDLALIQTDKQPQQFAPLRFNIDDLRAGDKVLIIGYPGEAGARGEYKVSEAQVQDLALNAVGKPGQFYISDSVEHGNSGGPVFDTSGNVIGVVVAKTVLTTINKQTQQKLAEQQVGVAISLATLKDFLFMHGVYTEVSGSGILFSDSYIEQRAKDYIVNVQCRLPVSSADAINPQ